MIWNCALTSFPKLASGAFRTEKPNSGLVLTSLTRLAGFNNGVIEWVLACEMEWIGSAWSPNVPFGGIRDNFESGSNRVLRS